MILLAAGKAAGSMIETAERHYLEDKTRAARAARGHRGGASRLWPAHASDRDDRSRPSGAGPGKPQFRRARARARAIRDGRRSRAGADVGRRVRQLGRARARPRACGKTGGVARAAALRRQYRRDQHGAQTSLAHQGRTACARRRSGAACHARDLRRAGRRSRHHRIGADRSRPLDARRRARGGRALQARSARERASRAQRSGQRIPEARRPGFCECAIPSRRAARGCVRGGTDGRSRRRIRMHFSRRQSRRRSARGCRRSGADGEGVARRKAAAP